VLGAAGADLSRPQAIEAALFEGLVAALEEEAGPLASEQLTVPVAQFLGGNTPPRQLT
jgi:hypothetical protein